MADEEVVVTQQDAPQGEPAPEVVADAAPEGTVAPVVPEAPKSDKALERMQQRIDELTYRLRERERQEAKQQEPVKQEPKAPPTLEDFAFDEVKFRQAQTEWTQAEIDRKVAERFEKAEQERAGKTREQTFQKRQEEFAKSSPEYTEKVIQGAKRGEWACSDAMAAIIQRVEHGPAVALYLASNPEIAANIAELPSVDAAYELGRIEAKFAVAPKAQPPVVKVSQAPPPPERIEAVDSTVSVKPTDPESDKLSDAEWRKARERQLARRKSG